MPDSRLPYQHMQRNYGHMTDPDKQDDAHTTGHFDRVARLAAHVFDVPMAAIVHADDGAPSVMASVGVDAAVIGRHEGLCLYAADQNEVTLIGDVARTSRWADHPLVAGAPHVRFYAGAPMRSEDGQVLGALCVMDATPQSVAPGAKKRLDDLAYLAAREVDTNHPAPTRPVANVELEHALDSWHPFINCHPDPMLVSQDAVIQYANPAAGRVLGADAPDDLLQRTIYDFIAPEYHSDMRRRVQAVKDDSVDAFEHEFVRLDGERRVGLSYSAPVLWNGDNAALTVLRDVTEWKAKETHLLELETALEHLTESVLITDAELDPPGPHILYANPAFEQLTGYRREEIYGHSPRLLQGRDTDPAVMEQLRRNLEAGERFEGETINYRKDGTPFTMQWSVDAVHDAGASEPLRYVAVQRDVTEQRAMERQLRYRAELESLIAQLSTRLLGANIESLDAEIEAALAELGRFLGAKQGHVFLSRGEETPEAHVLDNAFTWSAPGTAPRQPVAQSTPWSALPSWMDPLQHLEPLDVMATELGSDGATGKPAFCMTPESTRVIAAPIAWDDDLRGFVIFGAAAADAGQPSVSPPILKLIGDLFAQALVHRSTQETLMESEQRFHELLESLDDVVWAVDINSDASPPSAIQQIRYMNGAAEAIYGHDREDFFDRPGLWFEAVHDDDRAAVAQASAALFETGAEDYECRIVRPDGDVRWVRHRVRLQYDDHGRPTGMGGIATDITRRKATEQELLETSSRLETMVRHLQSGLLFEDESREVLYVNDRFCRLFDIDAPPEALLGTDCKANLEAAAGLMRDPDAFMARIDALLAVRKPTHGDIIEFADGRIYERDFIPVFSGNAYQGHLWAYRDVTERYQLDQHLRESARKLASEQAFIERVLDTLTDLFVVLTPEGHFVRWNDKLEQMTGYAAEELSALSAQDLFAAPVWGDIEQAIDEVMHEGEAHLTAELQTKSGSRVPYEFTGSRLDARGDGPLLCIIGRDITERKEAEEALQQERDLLDNIMNTSVAAIAVADTTGHIIFANKRAESVLRLDATPDGPTPYAPLALRLADAEGEPLPSNALPIRRVVASGRPILNQHVIATWQDDTRRHLSMNAAPLTSDAGHVVRVVLSVEDITERIRADRKLAQSERKYRRLFDASNDAIFLHTPDGVILDANTRASELFGFSSEELVGTAVKALHPPEAHDTSRAAFHTLREDGGVRFQAPCRRRDESTFWGEVSASLFQIDGTPMVQGIIRDITAQKEAEKRTQRALEKERELGQLKSRFVSMASHELRTPLTTIQSSSELSELYVQQGDVEKATRYLARIRKTVGSMTELLEDVLHFGRAESGRLPFSPDTLDAGSMVHKLVQEVQRGTGADHVFDVQGLDRIGLIDADEQLFRLILSNLLSNAVKYSDAGSTIRVEMERRDETLQMSVADEGIGIPEDQRDRLFDPFYRAENVGTIRGTGLGLAILNEAVALHGGTVAVESTCGVGTTFTVQLPLCQPEAEPPA